MGRAYCITLSSTLILISSDVVAGGFSEVLLAKPSQIRLQLVLLRLRSSVKLRCTFNKSAGRNDCDVNCSAGLTLRSKRHDLQVDDEHYDVH